MSARMTSLVLALLASFAPAAHSALASVSMSGVTIGSSAYDIRFWYDSSLGTQTFNAVFGTGAPVPALTFTTQLDATAAANAIYAAAVAQSFDFNLGNTALSPSLNGFIVPFTTSDTTFTGIFGWVNSPPLPPGVVASPNTIARNVALQSAFATFDAVRVVPSPAPLALLAAGLVGLAATRRRVK